MKKERKIQGIKQLSSFNHAKRAQNTGHKGFLFLQLCKKSSKCGVQSITLARDKEDLRGTRQL
jgi:hypothetical protein